MWKYRQTYELYHAVRAPQKYSTETIRTTVNKDSLNGRDSVKMQSLNLLNSYEKQVTEELNAVKRWIEHENVALNRNASLESRRADSNTGSVEKIATNLAEAVMYRDALQTCLTNIKTLRTKIQRADAGELGYKYSGSSIYGTIDIPSDLRPKNMPGKSPWG